MDRWDRIGKQEDPDPNHNRLWTLLELYQADLKPVEGALCDRVFPPKSVGILIGDFGIGKTWLTFSLASAIALGDPWGHMPTRQRPVLYVSEEMTEEEMHERAIQLFSPFQAAKLGPVLSFRFRTGLKAENPADCAELLAAIQAAGAQVVIIDATRDIHSCDENSNNEMSTVFRNLRDLVAKPGNVCIILIHHTSKPSEFRKGAHRGRGAVVVNDVCSDILVIEKGEGGQNTVSFEKVRHGKKPSPFAYRVSEGADDDSKVVFEITSALGGDDDMGLVDVKKLADWIIAAGGQTLDGIMKHFSWGKSTARDRVAKAMRAGLLENSQSPGHTAIYVERRRND